MIKRASLAAILFFLSILTASVSAADEIDSVYTDLSPEKCRTIPLDEETGGSIQECPGIAGYQLQILESNSRMSVTVVGPTGKEYPLEFWNVITQGLSTIGAKAEWRVVKRDGKVQPFALIVPVNAIDNPKNPKSVTSYLAVTKIGLDKICVTDKITPGPQANAEARRAADASNRKPCLKGADR